MDQRRHVSRILLEMFFKNSCPHLGIVKGSIKNYIIIHFTLGYLSSFPPFLQKKSNYGTNQFAALPLAASTEPNLIASRRFQIAPPKQALSWQHRREACAHVAAAAAGRMEMKFAPVTQISTSAWIPTQNLLDLLFVASTLLEL